MLIFSRATLALFILIASSIAGARTDGIYNPASNSVGSFEGIDSNAGTGGVAVTGKMLLVDGVSFVLQVDAASKLCRAGGC